MQHIGLSVSHLSQGMQREKQAGSCEEERGVGSHHTHIFIIIIWLVFFCGKDALIPRGRRSRNDNLCLQEQLQLDGKV